MFVPEQPDEEALPAVEGWRYHRVPTRPMVVWEQFRLPRLARRLGLDVVITASERAALWGPPEVVYVYEHPRHRAQRSREVGTSLRQRLVDSTTQLALPRRDAACRRRDSPPPRRPRAISRRCVQHRCVHSGIGAEFSPGARRRAPTSSTLPRTTRATTRRS